MEFLGKKYLFQNKTAQVLYSQAKDLPIVDLHNHSDVKEIIKNENWDDIWQVEAETDHYVWELMRRRGVSEELITGKSDNKKKWMALSKVFPEFIGNPTYEWIHLDLKRRFGIDKLINLHNAEYIWEKTSQLLSQDYMKPQNLLKEMNVEIMCTTDNPISSLDYHKTAQEKLDWIDILPTWRPDKAMNINKDDWNDFISDLEERVDDSLYNLNKLLIALEETHNYFSSVGCRASDHGILEPISYKTSQKEVDKIYKKSYAGDNLAQNETKKFKAFMLNYFGELNLSKGWITQLHIGAVRDYRLNLYNKLGKDSGGDVCTHNINITENLKYFLNQFDSELEIIIYYLNPVHLPAVTTIARSFPNVEVGAPWWFNDSVYGMDNHLRYLSTVDLLYNQASMVTDSRKLMSYSSRTEVFRRVLSNVMGEYVERGQVPLDEALTLVKEVCYSKPLKKIKKQASTRH